jgi:hypothetical protein
MLMPSSGIEKRATKEKHGALYLIYYGTYSSQEYASLLVLECVTKILSVPHELDRNRTGMVIEINEASNSIAFLIRSSVLIELAPVTLHPRPPIPEPARVRSEVEACLTSAPANTAKNPRRLEAQRRTTALARHRGRHERLATQWRAGTAQACLPPPRHATGRTWKAPMQRCSNRLEDDAERSASRKKSAELVCKTLPSYRRLFLLLPPHLRRPE